MARASHVWGSLFGLLLCGNVVLPDTNKYYHTSTLCLHENQQAMYKQVDGAVVTSENEVDMRCVVTFQTESILQTFMLRFEHLALDCNDHLYVFDGSQEYGKYEVDLSCRSTRTDVGTLFTRSNFLTLKYQTDHRSHAGNGFRLVITAVKKPGAGCRSFRCLNDLCISLNLTCDGVNHCGDNSDETSQALCGDDGSTKQILGLNFGTFVSLVLGGFLICCVCVVALIVCVFHREARERQLQQHPSTMVLPHTYPTAPRSPQEKPPPYPGNPAYCRAG